MYEWKLQVTIFWYVISQGAGLKEGSITRDYSLMPDTNALNLDYVRPNLQWSDTVNVQPGCLPRC